MRFKSLILTSLMFASLALVGVGCGQQTSNTTGDKTSDTCGNPYYPFKPGMAITYHETSSAGSSDYTIRTVSVAGTTATIRAELADGSTADMTADCASGSVELKGSSSLGAAMQGTTFKTTIVSSTGMYMPANVKAGSAWSNSETIRMDLSGDAAASLGSITLTTTEQSRAISEESVTVPAGTFTAMKVEIKRTSTTVAKMGKIPPSTQTSTEWWVKGIGMVKTVTVSQDGTSTIEAKSITGL
ncbi:MAG: hypothetical protein WC762_14120 [Methylobacter sp.]|jgi:hypothetical protein